MGEVFTELERRKILAILGTSRDLIKLTLAKIYTSDKNGENWLFSDLDGFLCFILDHNLKTRFFVMFDFDTYEKLFQFELYNDFSNAFQPLSDDFYCFEYAQSFIGFKFCDSKEANMFQLVVSKFNENFVNMLFESSSKTKKLLNKQENVHLYCEILKEKFSGGKKLDETYIEDGLEICKSRYFELMNNISYDRDKKEFIIGKIPEQLKSMFKDCGLKKSDFKNTQFALNIFKHFIQTIDAIDSNKKLVIDEKVFTNGIKNNFSGILKNKDGESDNTGGNRSKMNTIISSNSQESYTTESTNSEIKKVVYFEKAEKLTSDIKLIEKVENISLIEETNSLEIQKIDLKIKESNIPDSEIHKISEDSKISNLTNNIPCQNLPNIPLVPNIPKIANIPNIPKVPQIPTVPKVNKYLLIYFYLKFF